MKKYNEFVLEKQNNQTEQNEFTIGVSGYDCDDVHLFEMATVAKPNWEKVQYKVAIHGPASSDRPSPHIHIYLLNGDDNHKKFNFEITLIDLLCDDELNLSKQLDKRGNKEINTSDKQKCSWNGYNDIKQGLKDFLSGDDKKEFLVKTYKNYNNGLEALVSAYNNECNIENGFGKFFETQGLTDKVLPKYKYLLSNFE